jgi:hydroxyacylglutathione hydrolase
MITIKQFVFSPVQENTYVVADEQGDCFIIDPGCYFGNERQELKEFIEESGLTPKYLLNTHCHLDHVFGNKFVHETWGLTLHLHEKEKVVLDHAPASGLSWGLPFDNYQGPLEYLREGGTIRLGAHSFKIIFTPGHSPGSISFYYEPQHLILSGDVLFHESIGRTDLPGGDFNTLADSIRSQLYSLPDDTIVYSGHGPETTIGHEKKHNPFVKAG